MRIISGKYKGRHISPPKNLKVRPTTDIAKEGLFDILNNRIDYEETTVLDMFGGTGSISLEFASRGCPEITLIELNSLNYTFIRKTIAELNIDNIRTLRTDTFKYLSSCRSRFDLIFADPPYDHKGLPTLPDIVFEKELLKSDGIFILEPPKEFSFSGHPRFSEHRNYGHVNFTFFK